MTGLANRSLLEDRVGQAVKHAARKRLAFSVAAMRIDRFETVDSSLGAEDTDKLLEELGRRLQHAGRAEDTLAYLGGGSLAALLPGAAGPAEATAVVGGILSAVAEPITVGRHELFLTLSMGVAIYPSDGVDGGRTAAQRRRGHAPGVGRGRRPLAVLPLQHERRAQADRLALDAELHRALDADQFFLEYQPIVNAATEADRRRRGAGALAPPGARRRAAAGLHPRGRGQRRPHPHRARGSWRRPAARGARGSGAFGIVPAHERQHQRPATARRRRWSTRCAGSLRATGSTPARLELEITETAAMRDARHTAQILGALRAMGVRIALDDFGTGYSSLSHLVRLPISTVKIDRSFVRDLLAVPEHAAVAASVIALGHRLGLTVVAEGVETIGERGALRDEGCDAIQGFLVQQAGFGGGVRRAPRGGRHPALSAAPRRAQERPAVRPVKREAEPTAFHGVRPSGPAGHAP